jgi:hypothetical protein
MRAKPQALIFARLLIAAGHGPARLPTCEHTLRHARTETDRDVNDCPDTDVSVVVVRALRLFRPGELRALRVRDCRVFRLVSSMLQPRSDDAAPTSPLEQAVDSLCAVELAPSRDATWGIEMHVVAVIERCAGTVTELKGPLPGQLLSASNSWGHPSVLARCTRLEVLTDVSSYTPAVWLALSQLHTLRHVSFHQVSAAAIAVALPRLHTLTAYGCNSAVAVAGSSRTFCRGCGCSTLMGSGQ